MVLLDIDQFLARLERLYIDKKAGGSVWMTFKRTAANPAARKGRKKARADKSDKDEHVCLVRATDGKKKISTEVSAKEQIKFQIALSELMKYQLDGLKKRDRRKEREGHLAS